MMKWRKPGIAFMSSLLLCLALVSTGVFAQSANRNVEQSNISASAHAAALKDAAQSSANGVQRTGGGCGWIGCNGGNWENGCGNDCENWENGCGNNCGNWWNGCGNDCGNWGNGCGNNCVDCGWNCGNGCGSNCGENCSSNCGDPITGCSTKNKTNCNPDQQCIWSPWGPFCPNARDCQNQKSCSPFSKNRWNGGWFNKYPASAQP